MRDRLLRIIIALALGRPRQVVLGAVLLTFISAALVPGLYVDAGHTKMSAEDDPHIVRLHEFLEDFGSPNALVLMVRGGDEALRRAVVDRLGEDLPGPADGDSLPCDATASERAPGCVEDLLGSIDVDGLANHAMLYLNLEEVGDTVVALKDPDLGLGALVGIHGLRSLFGTLSRGLEARAEDDPPEGEARETARRALAGTARVFDVLAERVEHPAQLSASLEEAVLGEEEIASQALQGIDAKGYLSSGDGTIKIAPLQPVHDSDDPLIVAPFVDYVAQHTERIRREMATGCAEEACPDGQLRIDLTGLPAVVRDESRTLTTDIAITSVVAFIGIALLFGVGFRSLALSLLGLAPLVMALIWDLAYVRQAFGYLNIVTSSFMAVFLGLGVDFAVHLLARYQEARREGHDERESAEQALLGAGPGILTGGLTTAGAFLALSVVEFKAFAEMGLMSGVGIVMALVATLTVLPALLVMPELRRLQGQVGAPSPRKRHHGLPELVESHPRLFVLSGLLIAGFMAFVGGKNSFDYDYMSLLPIDLPSTRAWVELTEKTDYSPEVCALVADSLEEAAELAARLETKETVARVEVITAYLPQAQAAKSAVLRQLAPLIPAAADDRFTPDPADHATVTASLGALIDTIEDLRFEAVRASPGDAGLFDPLLASTKRLQAAIGAVAPAERDRRLAPLQASVIDLRTRGVALLRHASTGATLDVATLLARLPTALSERLHSRGRYAVYAYPSQPIRDGEFLRTLVEEVRSVSATATGFPINHWEFLSAIEVGFHQASVVTLLAVFFLILLDFRRLGATLLALAPLTMGILWTLGAMALMGMKYNGANVIGFPLLVGIGVDTGVHILHRHIQEAGENIANVVRHTGRAVLLATGTTMIGFGSLALATHRGMATLGQVLLIGMGTCLLTATLFLPALLQMIDGSGAGDDDDPSDPDA